MKQVFLIAAHKDPAQLNALVERLRDEDFLIYVHLDAKGAIEPAEVHPAARLVGKRVAVHWGCFSQVEATLNSLEQIVAEVSEFDKVLFLSAQDFPLLSNAALKSALAELRRHELLDTAPIGRGPGQWAAAYRYQFFYRQDAGRALRLACSLANRTMRACGLTRRMPYGLQPHGGSSWWALSRDCVRDVLARIRREPGLLRFFRSVSCADELFFQTLVMNSRFRERVLPENFRYVQWPQRGARNPKILDEHDFERIAASKAHFCRKIDSRASAALLQRLEALRAD